MLTGNGPRLYGAATRDRLSRIRDLAMVERLRRKGFLVPVPSETPTYYVEGVEPRLRVARPWTRRFIEQLADAPGRSGLRA